MGLRVLVVGGGGREHAIVWKLAQSPRTAALFCVPGNAGTSEVAENIPARPTDAEAIIALAQERKIDLAVIGPEEPLAAGVADRLTEAGIPVFGHSTQAAQLESSKAFAKEIMAAAGVPTARSVVVDDLVAGLGALNDFDLPVVIKADGLAAGKGVVITPSRHEAQTVLTAFLEDRALGGAGQRVVIEDCLAGQEISVFALVEGETVVTLPAACDYKRIYDGNRGPNTGGMGGYCPVPSMPNDLLADVKKTILEPTVREMSRRGMPMRGVLYAGLIMTDEGPQVLEFNVRFGDPEAQLVLPLVDVDLTELFDAIAHGRLADVEPPRPVSGAAVGVVAASGGYPGPCQTGLPIDGLEDVPEDVLVFHAGTARNAAGKIVTAGGRVLTLVGLGETFEQARERAYAAVDAVSFDQIHVRRDIALREIA